MGTSPNQGRSNIYYFTLLFIGSYSYFTQKYLAKRYYNNLNVKLLISTAFLILFDCWKYRQKTVLNITNQKTYILK